MKDILKDYRDKYENCLLTGEKFDFDGLETELQAWAVGVKAERDEDFELELDELKDEIKELKRNVSDLESEKADLENHEVVDIEDLTMDQRAKLEAFLAAEIFPYYNEQAGKLPL